MNDQNNQRLTILEALGTLSKLSHMENTASGLSANFENGLSEEKLKKVFETLSGYATFVKDALAQTSDLSTQESLNAVVHLAHDAIENANKCTHLFNKVLHKKESLLEITEIQAFFSQNKERASLSSKEEALNSSEKVAITDLERVSQDREYDLFYLSKKNGETFCSKNLLKSIELIGEFDASISSIEGRNPLRLMEQNLDSNFNKSAKIILEKLSKHIEHFYKQSVRSKELEIVGSLNKCLMALMLAANPRNLTSNASYKSCAQYFIDFQKYLRDALTSKEYLKYSSSEKGKNVAFRSILTLVNELCGELFLRPSNYQVFSKMIHSFAYPAREANLSMWSELKSFYENINDDLRNYTSGPLLKFVSAFKEKRNLDGFDPFLQYNAPFHLFTLTSENWDVGFLHMPTPTHQLLVEEVTINEEFKGYLNFLNEKKHLYINLQDRTAWEDVKRCSELESLSSQKERQSNLMVVTLAKDSDFYHQSKEYEDQNSAAVFCKEFNNQLVKGESSGFHLPTSPAKKESISQIIQFVHDNFFGKKNNLSKKERLDFIEIFYFFYIVTLLEETLPNFASFSCKDGIDTGACASALFFGFSRMLSSSLSWTPQEKDFFLYTLYSRAFCLRNRSVDGQRFFRALSALEYFESVMKEHRAEILRACSGLLPNLPVQKIHVSDAA